MNVHFPLVGMLEWRRTPRNMKCTIQLFLCPLILRVTLQIVVMVARLWQVKLIGFSKIGAYASAQHYDKRRAGNMVCSDILLCQINQLGRCVR